MRRSRRALSLLLLIRLNENRFLEGLDVVFGDPAVISLPRDPPKNRDLDLKL